MSRPGRCLAAQPLREPAHSSQEATPRAIWEALLPFCIDGSAQKNAPLALTLHTQPDRRVELGIMQAGRQPARRTQRASAAGSAPAHSPLIKLEQDVTALQAFAEFFAIDHDLIAGAAEASASLAANDEPLERWLTLLREAERNDFLLRLVRGEPHVAVALLRRLRAVAGTNTSPATTSPRRSCEELQTAAKRQAQVRRHHERTAAEQARLAKLETLVTAEAKRSMISFPYAFRDAGWSMFM
jgi:hypothetical protein